MMRPNRRCPIDAQSESVRERSCLVNTFLSASKFSHSSKPQFFIVIRHNQPAFVMLSPSACFAITFLVFLRTVLHVFPQTVPLGTWQLLTQNSGVSAMHMTLTSVNTVIMFDRTDYGPSRLVLPAGRCRNDPNDLALTQDCYAHSIELDLASNKIRPLEVLTDTWCSSAAFLANGTLVNTGGYNDGAQAIRFFTPCSGQSCDWYESSIKLAVNRWYASNQILPDNRIIVVGGRRSFSYEFIPKQLQSQGVFRLPFLSETNEHNAENNLYPFLHLSSDGNLFVFANRQSILLDYNNNRVIKAFPDIPDGPRNYPSSGSCVMLPLSAADNFLKVEVMICGGAPYGSFQLANNQSMFVDALKSCGRMVITDSNPSWEMEDMPSPRVMGDMLILPTGEILMINGAQKGTAGWYNGREPALKPVLYRPDGVYGQRFQELGGTNIPRMYHSTANVLPDGRILVGGSNPNVGYDLSGVLYPTELSIETYGPYYLDPSFDMQRPNITFVSVTTVPYNSNFTVHLSLSLPTTNSVEFRIYAPPFTTHTYSMNQRQLLLASSFLVILETVYVYTVASPPNSIAAPPGYYLLFAVNESNIPSKAAWVHFS